MISRLTKENASPLVLLDIGNSTVAVAIWTDGKRSDADHLPTEPIGAVDDALQQKWNQLSRQPPPGVLISSVNPEALDSVQARCEASGIGPLLIVGTHLDPPMVAALPEPEMVGSDRICSAAAAYARYKGACVVADFGTALTIDLVSEAGQFLGGTILPGLALSARALHEHTALLPLVAFEGPTEVPGQDTVRAIRSGVLAMMAGALREITERYATGLGRWPPLILTGGDAQAVARTCDYVDLVAPDLCLDGLVIAYQQMFSGRPDL